MKLKRIEARGLKGRRFAYDLSEAVAIVGSNFAGKSAILDAIRLVFIGHLPEVGKLASATWELANGEELSVQGTFDTGTLTRRWILKNGVPSGLVFADEVSVEALESIPLLHNEHYFSLSDAKRTDYVFEHIRLPSVFTVAAIIAGAERISLGEEHSEAVENAKQALIAELRTTFGPSSNLEQTVQAGLSRGLELLKERFTYWNRRAKETQGAVRLLTELKLRESEASAETLRELGAKINAAAERKSELDEKRGRLTSKRDQAERVARRVKELRRELTAEGTDHSWIIDERKKEIQALKNRLVPLPDNIIDMVARASELTRECSPARSKLGLISLRIAQRREQLDELDSVEHCPYCLSAGKGWKARLEQTLEESVAADQKEVKQLTEEVEKLEAEGKSLQTQLTKANENDRENERIKAKIAELEREVVRLISDKAVSHARRKKLDAELGELEKIPTGEDVTAETEATEKERQEAALEVSRLGGRLETARKLAHDLKRAAEAQLEHADAAAYVVMVKALQSYLQAKRSEIVTVVFDKLLKVANQLCGEILLSPLALHAGTIGRWDDEKFIPHRVFSGTEKALAYIGIAIALSVDAPLRIPILDEFGRLDRENRAAVVDVLWKMVKGGTIDQFIVAGTSLDGVNDDGLQVIEVGS